MSRAAFRISGSTGLRGLRPALQVEGVGPDDGMIFLAAHGFYSGQNSGRVVAVIMWVILLEGKVSTQRAQRSEHREHKTEGKDPGW
jgi:hypothetical protein